MAAEINQTSKTTKIKAIFFDLDNTLIETRRADLKTCHQVRFYHQ